MLMADKGCDYETAKKELADSWRKNKIPYRFYVTHQLYRYSDEKQLAIYNESLEAVEKQASASRNKFVRKMAEKADCPRSIKINRAEFEEKNRTLKYDGRFDTFQPEPVIAACYYLGNPLPSNASGAYQPSAFIPELDGSLEGIRSCLGEEILPDTDEYREEYESFRKKFTSMRKLQFTETDLAVYYTDYLLHCKDYGFRNTDYFDFDFFKSGIELRNTFISTKKYKRYVRRICIKDITLFKDKGNFNRKFAAVVRRDWVDTTLCTWDEFNAFVSRNPVFFAKPIRGTGGAGACVIHSEDYDRKDLFSLCREREYIIEERVKQHKDLAAFNPDTLNTIRVYALVDIEGKPHMTGVFARFGRVGGTVDNFHQGGMGAAVDPETGIMMTDAVDIRGAANEIHPDSHLRFKGTQLPEWERVKETVAKACEICKNINRHVGWDIAIREDGEVEVIEGNATPNFDFLQAVDKIGKYPIYDKYLTPMAIAAGIKPIHAENPTLDVSRMQNPPIEFV